MTLESRESHKASVAGPVDILAIRPRGSNFVFIPSHLRKRADALAFGLAHSQRRGRATLLIISLEEVALIRGGEIVAVLRLQEVRE